MMWAVNTNLCPNPNTCGDDIKKKLEIGSGNPLNASTPSETAQQTRLRSRKPRRSYDKVDMNDFSKFKDGYQQVRDNRITDDLNLDTKRDANDRMFCRIDLDGNGKVEAKDLEVMIRA